MIYDKELVRIAKKYNLYCDEDNFDSEKLYIEICNILKDKCKVITAHPGISATNILAPKAGGFSVWFSKLGSRFLKIFTHSPFKASLSIVIGINKENKTNTFFGPRVLEISGYPKVVKYNKNSILIKEDLMSKAKELTNKDFSLLD